MRLCIKTKCPTHSSHAGENWLWYWFTCLCGYNLVLCWNRWESCVSLSLCSLLESQGEATGCWTERWNAAPIILKGMYIQYMLALCPARLGMDIEPLLVQRTPLVRSTCKQWSLQVCSGSAASIYVYVQQILKDSCFKCKYFYYAIFSSLGSGTEEGICLSWHLWRRVSAK